RRSPRESSAFFVPTPGCTPPNAARTPTRSSTYAIPSSRFGQPRRMWSSNLGTISGRAGRVMLAVASAVLAVNRNLRRDRCFIAEKVSQEPAPSLALIFFVGDYKLIVAELWPRLQR